MFRIDHPTASPSLPPPSAPGTPGYFTGGSPLTATPPTIITPDWANAIQEEIIAVLAAAGIAPNKGSLTQLRDAILALASPGSSGGVPTSRLINTVGLLTGGGSLAANLTLSVLKAAGSDITAGTSDMMAMTPAAFADHVGTAANMFRIGNRIFVTGSATAFANNTTVVTLPTTFPVECSYAGCNGGSVDESATENGPFVLSTTRNTISVYSARNDNVPITYFAFGR